MDQSQVRIVAVGSISQGRRIRRALGSEIGRSLDRVRAVYRIETRITYPDHGYQKRNTNGGLLLFGRKYEVVRGTVSPENEVRDLPQSNKVFDANGVFPRTGLIKGFEQSRLIISFVFYSFFYLDKLTLFYFVVEVLNS